MASKPPVAVYDACVLYPFHLRNVLVQCAFDGLVEARWSDDIHDEWIRNLAANTPSLSIERLIATRDRMKAVLPEADVTTYRPLVNDLKLPDSGDRHVLAAAIAGRAPVIVTWNLKDFPPQDLQPYGVRRKCTARTACPNRSVDRRREPTLDDGNAQQLLERKFRGRCDSDVRYRLFQVSQ